MPSQQNQAQVSELQTKVAQAKSITIIDYSGTTVNDQVKLRRAISEAGGEMLVTKNTLMDLAAGKGKLSDSLQGMNAFVFAYDDEVAPIKALFTFQKETEKLVIKQGLLADNVLSPSEVERLSALPSKAELVSGLLLRLQSPASGLANVLKAGQRDLVYVLSALASASPKTN